MLCIVARVRQWFGHLNLCWIYDNNKVTIVPIMPLSVYAPPVYSSSPFR